VLASAVLLGAAILSVKAVNLITVARARLDLDKSELGLMRLVHFVALAYLISAATVAQPWAERTTRIVGGPLGRSLQGMGRNSLLFFAFGSLSSAGGRSLMLAAAALGTPRLAVHFMGLAYTMAAIAGMFALAHRIDRTQLTDIAAHLNGQGQLDDVCGAETELPPGLTLKPCPRLTLPTKSTPR
jgi:hypothetical protein